MARALEAVLAAYLFAWIPFSFANELLRTLSTFGMRGTAAGLELVLHGAVAALSAAAGWMLWAGAPAALGFAAAAVFLSGLVSVQPLLWSALPRATAPGEALPLAAIAVGHTVFWLLAIEWLRSRRQRPTSA